MSTTSHLSIDSEGDDTNGTVTTYALKATIQNQEITFPIISPHQIEIERAVKRELIINSPSVTYLEHVITPRDFIENQEIVKCGYEEFARIHTGKLVNYSFDLHPNHNVTEELRDANRYIQIDANSQFFFEHEVDIDQNADALMQQLAETQQWLLEQDSNKILVPIIDMKIEEEGLFLKKLERLSSDFKRINVIYRSPNQSPGNWVDLKAFLNDNEIWCHMDCVLNRYNSNKIAHRVSLYSIGISSSSIARSFGGGGSHTGPSIYRFDPPGHNYRMLGPPHEPTFAEREDRVWIESLNAEIKELQNMREQVIRKTLYSTFIPTRRGTADYLISF